MAEIAMDVTQHMSLGYATETEVEICPEDIPLPRSSMITVRLSDASAFSVLEEDVELDVSPETAPLGSSPSSIRSSRSSSQSSDKSASLNLVNWEGLEKTEEQEPRDEASDEVSLHNGAFECHRLIRIVNRPLARPFREGKCCFGDGPEGRHCSTYPSAEEHPTTVDPAAEEDG